MLIELSYENSEFIAELYKTLASYYQEIQDKEGNIDNMKKVYLGFLGEIKFFA